MTSKSSIFFIASIASSPLIKSLAPDTTMILFCPELSTHIGATPLDPGTLCMKSTLTPLFL